MRAEGARAGSPPLNTPLQETRLRSQSYVRETEIYSATVRRFVLHQHTEMNGLILSEWNARHVPLDGWRHLPSYDKSQSRDRRDPPQRDHPDDIRIIMWRARAGSRRWRQLAAKKGVLTDFSIINRLSPTTTGIDVESVRHRSEQTSTWESSSSSSVHDAQLRSI